MNAIGNAIVLGGDCLTVLRDMESESVHSIVTDPPYGLSEVGSEKLTTALTAWVNGDRERVPSGKGFMGKEWDAFVPPPAVWDECMRVLKPGGHMLVFAGSRTVDLMGLSIRLAGFEIRDTLQWLNGAGFPKSHDVSKAIDKAAGAQREVVGTVADRWTGKGSVMNRNGRDVTNGLATGEPVALYGDAATDDAREWEGWGTALKPAAEPIILARKPLESTVARNVLAHGTGGINIDGCRVESGDNLVRPLISRNDNEVFGKGLGAGVQENPAGGRFPANVILSHAETCDDDVCDEGCPVAELDAQSGNRPGFASQRHLSPARPGMFGVGHGAETAPFHEGYNDSGGASRFFASFRYQAKAPKRERPKVDGVSHPTVKPVALMRWLVRLVTPPGGTVLDPFAGSGTTLQAANEEGFASIGIERDDDYLKLIYARLGSQEESAA